MATTFMKHFELQIRGWRNSSAVKGTDCPSRGRGFIPPNPHRDQQLVITAVLGDPKLSSGLQGRKHICGTQKYIHTHKIKSVIFIQIEEPNSSSSYLQNHIKKKRTRLAARNLWLLPLLTNCIHCVLSLKVSALKFIFLLI